eukprot:358032-Chlamydomonas_euryale.AAC.7
MHQAGPLQRLDRPHATDLTCQRAPTLPHLQAFELGHLRVVLGEKEGLLGQANMQLDMVQEKVWTCGKGRGRQQERGRRHVGRWVRGAQANGLVLRGLGHAG